MTQDKNTNLDIKYMKQCLDMAEEGVRETSPNPMVGAIVLDKNGKVVGRGYHKEYGGPHAEIFALEKAGSKAQDGTIYVSLEPCCHFGKTPPCVNKIIEAGIKKVVIAMLDPNPRVAGRGKQLLEAAQIEVVTGVLEEEAKELNKAFCKVHTTGFPLVVSKIAMTLDGKIATRTESSQWINCEESRNLAHHWRHRSDAIMTGSSTIIADDSRLNCRIPGGKDPLRVIIDSQLNIKPNSKIFTQNSTAQTILVTSNEHKGVDFSVYGKNTLIFKSPMTGENKVDLVYLMKYLNKEHRVNSILLETGPTLNGAMLKQGLIDKFYMFIAPKIIGDNQAYSPIIGINILDVNDAILLNRLKVRQIQDDILIKAWVNDDFRRLN